MPEITETRRLLARGVTIQLVHPSSGEPVDFTVRFSTRHLAQIEDHFGSLDAFSEAIGRKPIGAIAYVIGVLKGASQDEALDWLDSRQLDKYIEAIGDAVAEALPAQDASQGNGKAAPGTDGSPGAASSTLPSSAGTSTLSDSGT